MSNYRNIFLSQNYVQKCCVWQRPKALVTQVIFTSNIAIKNIMIKRHFSSIIFFSVWIENIYFWKHFCTNVCVFKRFLIAKAIFWQKNVLFHQNIALSFYCNIAYQNRSCDASQRVKKMWISPPKTWHESESRVPIW